MQEIEYDANLIFLQLIKSLVRAYYYNYPIIEQDRQQENGAKSIFVNMLMISLDDFDSVSLCV